MSRAFVREDTDPPDRRRRARSVSGLPPGALNYITPWGVARFRRELENARRATPADTARIADLEHVLSSVTVAETPSESATSVTFGTSVTVRNSAGELQTYRVVGVNELDLYENAVSWISPFGRALLAAELDGKVALKRNETGKIVRIERAFPIVP